MSNTNPARYKVRCFTFADQGDCLLLSIVLENGEHKYIELTESQGVYAYSQLGPFAARQMAKVAA